VGAIKMRGVVLGALLFFAWGGSAVHVWGQTKTTPVSSSAVLVRTGSLQVTVEEMRAFLGAQPDEVRQRILNNPKQLEEVVRGEAEWKALLVEARKAGVDKRADVVYLMRRAQEQAIVNAYLAPFRVLPEGYPSEAEMADYYGKHEARFVVPEQINVSTIFRLLLPAWAGDKAIEAKVQAEATRLSAQARNGSDFSDLARRHSQDRPTAEAGGVVGRVTAEQLLPELAEVARTLKPGQASEPIRTQFGFHVVRVNDRKPAVQRPLAEVRGEVVGLLRLEYRARKEREAVEAALKKIPPSVDSVTVERWRLDELKVRRVQ
jgi:parvulin-like peptidyl-prolyl isomerase